MKILRKDLGVKPFNIELVEELKPNVLPQRKIFGEWAPGKLAEDPLLYRKIVLSDEARFRLKQNCQFCSKNQPEALQKLPMHPEKVRVLMRFMGWWHHWIVLLPYMMQIVT